MEMRYAGAFGCRRCYMSPIKKNVWGNYGLFLDNAQQLRTREYVSNQNVQAIDLLAKLAIMHKQSISEMKKQRREAESEKTTRSEGKSRRIEEEKEAQDKTAEKT